MKEINEILAKFWGSRVTQYNIDIQSHVIDLQLVTHDAGGYMKTKMRFMDVDAVCFGVDLASQDMQSQFMECVSIEVRSSDVATLRASFHSHSGDDYVVYPNIVIEIDSSFLAVRAKSIMIGETVYSLVVDEA